MKKRINCILSLACCLFASPIGAQTFSQANIYQVTGAKSPEVASLSKFGNIPVSYSTGVPSIGIPIYDISIGELKVPVSLSYHAGGIRVDEGASSVGLGWALNAGGAISRSMIGLPDEAAGGYLYSPDFNTATSATGETSLAFPFRLRNGTAETTADIFSYDVGDIHGKFIYKRTGNGNTFLQFPMTNNRIEKVPVTNGWEFMITDTKGVQYHFGEEEQTQQGQGYTSAWRLTKIVNSNAADTIYFDYQKGGLTSFLFSSSTYTIGTTVDCSGSKPGIFGGTVSTGASSTVESYLKEIRWRSGKVVFNLESDRIDAPGAKRVSGIDIYNLKSSTYNLLKRVSLYHSNFGSVADSRALSANDSRNFRLKLDSVLIKNKDNTESQPYRMNYNMASMAPIGSFAQDIFGFNNGAFNNSDSFPRMITRHTTSGVDSEESYIGSANRDVDVNAMKAGVITDISYPTGGKTSFDFEAHNFTVTGTSQQNTVAHALVSSISGGNGVLTNINTFVFTEEMRNQLTYKASFSPYAGLANNPSYARIMDLTTGTQVVRINTIGYSTTGYNTGTQVYAQSGLPQLITGHQYSLESYIFSDAIGLSASIQFNWVSTDTSTVAQSKFGGGLRVAKITDYDRANKFVSSKKYEYGINGSGTLLTPPEYLGYNEEAVIYKVGCSDPNSGGVNCINYVGLQTYVLHQNSVLPLSQFNGSPVLYAGVTEYQVNQAGESGNGKNIYTYNVYSDNNAFPTGDYKNTGVALISNSWRNGYPASEQRYKLVNGGYVLTSNKQTSYQFYQKDSEPTIYIKSKYIFSGCEQTDQANVAGNFIINGYDIPTGVMLLDSTINTVIEDNSSIPLVTKERYVYGDPLNYNPTSKIGKLSTGQTTTENSIYPTLLSSDNGIYSTMVSRNIIDPVIKFQRLQDDLNVFVKNTNYGSFKSGAVLAPQNIELQIGDGPLEQRILVNDYDIFGNILDQQQVTGIHQSYIWGYKNAYPIAKIRNAIPSEVFVEGFEDSNNSTSLSAHTGDKYHNGSSYTVTWAIPNNKSYLISYWYIQGDKWFFSGDLPFNGSYVLTGGDGFDDIRIQPSDARLSTFTYDPLVGMTSTVDEGGHTTYYEYDSSQRLMNVRDHDKNITKNYKYHYNGAL